MANTSILADGSFRLHDSELIALRGEDSNLKTVWRMLNEMSIPPTIEQGDFKAGNVAVREGVYIHYDWGETVISYPFFNLLGFTSSTPVPPADIPKIQNAFLAPWLEYAPKGHLLDAIQLARQVYPLYRAIWIHRKKAICDGAPADIPP